jgi:hypothetical protein
MINKSKPLNLKNPKEVMEAFLNGNKLQNSCYNDESGEHYLQLVDGQICEEDGAGAKSDRVPILMRNNEEWWIIV